MEGHRQGKIPVKNNCKCTKGGNGWDFDHFGQKSLFHFIEQI